MMYSVVLPDRLAARDWRLCAKYVDSYDVYVSLDLSLSLLCEFGCFYCWSIILTI